MKKNNVYKIIGSTSRDGKKVTLTKELDLNKFNLQKNSLILAVTHSFPNPIDLPSYSMFSIVLKILEGHNDVINLLSSPINELTAIDITTLFTTVEYLIDQKLVISGSYNSGSIPSMTFRRFINYLQLPLGDGSTISDVRFKTKFKTVQGSRGLISAPFNNTKNPSPTPSLTAPKIDDLQNKALEHISSDTKKIKDACYDVIHKHQKLRDELKQLEIKKLSENLEHTLEDKMLSSKSTKKILNELSPTELLHFYSRFFCKHNLYSLSEFKSWYQSIDTMPAVEKLCQHKHFINLGFVYTKKNYKYQDIAIILILTRKIFSALPILCIRHLFQLELTWNMGTCNSIARNMITFTNDGAHIKAIKTKTSQQFSKTIVKNSLKNSAFYSSIQTLTDNFDYIQHYWAHESDSIFSAITLRHNFPIATRFNYTAINKRFIALYNLPNFSAEQLRVQSLNIHYLETQDIHSLQSIAGWSNISTAQSYLDQGIIKMLSQANIFDFMQRLESSIIWSIKGNEGLNNFGINIDSVDKELLFPINSNQVNVTSLSDKWLDDNTIPIVIDNDRMSHTLRQLKFYKEHWQKLFSANEDKFLSTHLPRILLCTALDMVLRESEHSPHYNKMEAAVDE